MTVYSTQSSGRDARHALATPHFLPPKRTPQFVDEGHGRTLVINSTAAPARNGRISQWRDWLIAALFWQALLLLWNIPMKTEAETA